MANTYHKLTGQSTPSGNIPYALYTPTNLTKRQPLIIHLHGAGEGSPTISSGRANGGQHDEITVQIVDNSGVGLLSLTSAATLPSFTDPITGEAFEPYLMAPQLYYPDGTSYAFGVSWQIQYVTALISYAKSNLFIDHERIYLCGLSLGGGGTLTLLQQNASLRNQIAAAFACCPGYGNGSSLIPFAIEFAKSGLPIWVAHAINDASAPISVSETFVNRVNAAKPIRSPKHWQLSTGGHTIWMQFYTTGHPSISLATGAKGLTPNLFEWFFQYTKKGIYAPVYL